MKQRARQLRYSILSDSYTFLPMSICVYIPAHETFLFFPRSSNSHWQLLVATYPSVPLFPITVFQLLSILTLQTGRQPRTVALLTLGLHLPSVIVPSIVSVKVRGFWWALVRQTCSSPSLSLSAYFYR